MKLFISFKRTLWIIHTENLGKFISTEQSLMPRGRVNLYSFMIQNDVRWRLRHRIIHVSQQAVSCRTVLPNACQLSVTWDNLITIIGKYPITYHAFLYKNSGEKIKSDFHPVSHYNGNFLSLYMYNACQGQVQNEGLGNFHSDLSFRRSWKSHADGKGTMRDGDKKAILENWTEYSCNIKFYLGYVLNCFNLLRVQSDDGVICMQLWIGYLKLRMWI
jgi:hypothetical protein